MRTTTALTLGEAARESGQSKPTILRAIQKGRLSATKDEANIWMIEPVELFRVFERKLVDNPVQEPPSVTLDNPPVTGPVTGETPLVEALREQIEDLKEARDRERQLGDGLRKEIEQERAERARLIETINKQAEHVRLLTDQSSKPVIEPARPRGFLDWLLNRKPQ